MKLTILHCVEETDLSKLIYILNQLETEEIKAHNTLTPNGYNIESGGKVGAISLETRQKIRESLIGIKHTPERRLKQSLARIGKEPWNKGLKTPFSEVRKQQQSQIGYKSLHERWHVNRNIKKDDCYLC